jgi:hypothetical protein
MHVSKALYQPRRYEGTTYISNTWQVLFAPGHLYLPVKGTRGPSVPSKLRGHKARDVYRLLWLSVVERGPYKLDTDASEKRASPPEVKLPELMPDSAVSEIDSFADIVNAALHRC